MRAFGGGRVATDGRVLFWLEGDGEGDDEARNCNNTRGERATTTTTTLRPAKLSTKPFSSAQESIQGAR